jgi:hypothetical protein
LSITRDIAILVQPQVGDKASVTKENVGEGARNVEDTAEREGTSRNDPDAIGAILSHCKYHNVSPGREMSTRRLRDGADKSEVNAAKR